MGIFNPRVIEISNREEVKKEIGLIGSDEGGQKLMASKGVFRLVKIEGVTTVQANLIKQEMLSKGGEAAVARGVANFGVDKSDILLMGTLRQYHQLIAKLRLQPFKLSTMAEELCQVLTNYEGHQIKELDCSPYRLTFGEKTLVMGILNVTPDSFSDGGLFTDLDLAVEHAKRMIDEGADIIDVGAESTRPNHEPVPQEEELRRLIPAVERLAKEINVPISVDTYKAEVARQAVAKGAHIINDQWGCKADPDMARIMAELDVPVILMHNQKGTEYRSLMGEILHSLQECIGLAEGAGVKPEKIIIDPGIGLGKTYEQSLEVMKNLAQFKSLGKPILLGTSRKSLIGKTLNLPANERVEGTLATTTLGIIHGVDIVRVHDVKENVRAARMTDAMVRC
ncbi:MAG: dihydropteroate synthase [Clostridia bacterium]|nr:dihydropteroate synthase [Clostridia bacterium]